MVYADINIGVLYLFAVSSLGVYGSGRIAGGGQDSNTKLLLNFDRGGGTDFEDSSNIGGDGHKVTANNQAIIKASPFGDGKSAMYFDGSGQEGKKAIMGALTLYLDFINLFIMLIQLFGQRR